MATPPPPQPTRRQLGKIARRAAQQSWQKARMAERDYARSLANVGRQIGSIIRGMVTPEFSDPGAQTALQETLRRYSALITPWAERVTARMHAEVGRRDYQAWRRSAESIGKSLKQQIEQPPTGDIFRDLMAEQVTLIKTIPLDAAKEVHQMTIEALPRGERMETLIDRILKLGSDQTWKARRIARTETARTNAVLTQVRAEKIGSTHYYWRTMEDKAVRPDHRILNGKIFAWNDPPIADRSAGRRAHPGSIYNCRCEQATPSRYYPTNSITITVC